MKKIFITATDTDAGKTHIASALINVLTKQGLNVAAYKPISAGCELINNELVNEDAYLLSTQANCGQSIKQINPIAFEKAIAPHIAAQQLNQHIDLETIIEKYHEISNLQPEVIITEGAGGWRLPLGNQQFLSEFVVRTEQQVILIVNMKLGCLNHAILTYEAIINDGLTCVGWIANCQNNMPYLPENITELQQHLATPLLATIPFEKDVECVAELIDVSLIFKDSLIQFN